MYGGRLNRELLAAVYVPLKDGKSPVYRGVRQISVIESPADGADDASADTAA
jgi:hypothetical protein